jgi:hypothetical protein
MTSTPWDELPTPDQARLDWHAAARERDEAQLSQGAPADSESTESPWR